jgi:Flp pilus assembly protein TadD
MISHDRIQNLGANDLGEKPRAVWEAPPESRCADFRAFRANEYLSRGLALHLQGKPGEALVEYRRALDLDAGDPYGRYLMGLALKALGRDAEARGEWREARTLRAHDEDSLWGIAMAKKLLDSSY